MVQIKGKIIQIRNAAEGRLKTDCGHVRPESPKLENIFY